MTGSNIDSVLLSAETVGDILGTNLPIQMKGKRPAPEAQLDQHPECAPLFAPGTKFYGSDLNLFRITLFKDDKDYPDYIVIQTVATFPDAQTAQNVFSKGIQPTEACNSTVQITDLDSKPTWELSAPKVTGRRCEVAPSPALPGRPGRLELLRRPACRRELDLAGADLPDGQCGPVGQSNDGPDGGRAPVLS